MRRASVRCTSAARVSSPWLLSRVFDQQLTTVFAELYFSFIDKIDFYISGSTTRCLARPSKTATEAQKPGIQMSGRPASHPHSQTGRQASIMFWAVSADCSPPLPVSGLAIVAEAEWIGSEPEMMLKNLLCKQRGAGVYSQRTESTFTVRNAPTSRLAHNHTVGHSKKSHALAQHDNQRCTHTHTSEEPHRETNRRLPPFTSPSVRPRPRPLLAQREAAGLLDSRPVRVVSSNRISRERERERESVTTSQFAAAHCHY